MVPCACIQVYHVIRLNTKMTSEGAVHWLRKTSAGPELEQYSIVKDSNADLTVGN